MWYVSIAGTIEALRSYVDELQKKAAYLTEGCPVIRRLASIGLDTHLHVNRYGTGTCTSR